MYHIVIYHIISYHIIIYYRIPDRASLDVCKVSPAGLLGCPASGVQGFCARESGPTGAVSREALPHLRD